MRVSAIDFTDREIQEFIAEQEAQDIRSGSEFADAILHELDKPEVWGWRLPWDKTVERVRVRPGEVSIWAGIDGHLKSALVQQVATWQAQERRVGLMSFELTVGETLARACKQVTGTNLVSPDFGRKFACWLEDRIWIYDRLDSVPPEDVLGCVIHMARDLGIKFIVIDCLMMIKGVTRDNAVEAKFMGQLTALAKSLQVHIALVHHVRKPQNSDESWMPTRFDVRGAGELVGMVSSVFIIWHDKKKKRIQQKQDSGGILTEKELDHLERPDLILTVAKQRHGQFEGAMGFWVHKGMQISGHPVKKMFFDIDQQEERK